MTPAQSDVIADRLLELGVAPGMVERVRLALDPVHIAGATRGRRPLLH
jgi:hypothetical protein